MKGPGERGLPPTTAPSQGTQPRQPGTDFAPDEIPLAKTLAFVLLFLKQATTQMEHGMSLILFFILNCMLIDF